MRVLLFSLEFCDPIFSGNGTYSRTIADGLLQHFTAAKRPCTIDVICAAPRSDPIGTVEEIRFAPGIAVHAVPVPEGKWRRLDARGPWKEYATAAAQHWTGDANLPPHDVVLVVDWHGANCLHEITRRCEKPINVVYLNFRAFSNPSIVPDLSELELYRTLEAQAMQLSRMCICLSLLDKQLLQSLPHCGTVQVVVVLPPVRDIVLENARLGLEGKLSVPTFLTPDESGRRYIACCVRLTADKNALFFVDVIAELVKSKRLPSTVIPMLFGAPADAQYAELVKSKLRAVAPTAIVADAFLTCEDMAAIFCRSVLNVHPSLYDAFGLTIVEAAVCGCPSLVHQPIGRDSPVGAAQLVGERGAIYADFEQLNAVGTAETIADLLDEPHRRKLEATAIEAGHLGRGYTTVACGGMIASFLESEK